VPQSADDAKPGEASGKTNPQAMATSKAEDALNAGNTKTSAAAPSQQQVGSKNTGEKTDAIAMLKEDHRKVEELFSQFENADDDRKEQIIEEVCRSLIIHTLLEERVFYPAARQPATEDELYEAQVEHDAAKVLILELLEADSADQYRDAKFKVLAEEIKHHVREEEAPDGVLAKAQRAGVNTRELAERLTGLKSQLQQKAESGKLPDPQPASFRYGEQSNQETRMPTERDQYGRLASDDDNRGRSRGRDYDDDRNYRSRGSQDRERDSQGRFMSDDDDPDRGRGRSYAAGNGGRGRDHGGWFGDPEGHSEASRRGWDERESGSRGRYSRDDDDDRRYRSRGRDDEDDRSYRSRGSSDRERDSQGRFMSDDDRGRSRNYGSGNGGRGRDHGGWFGDSEGHSEAARRGWEEREGGSRGRSYRDDEDDRRYRSRGRDDDDDRRSSGGRGHGGWSGDPEGHAEAARRGWENRR
jgi:hemerythrin superfamily protein